MVIPGPDPLDSAMAWTIPSITVTVNTVTVDVDLNVRLLEAIRTAAGLPALTYAREPVSLTGGFWAELLAFSLARPPPGWPRELVARIMPDAGVARKETIVQAAVSAAGFPTPAVRASGGPDSGLGRAFMIMDRAAGEPLLPGLGGVAAIAAGLRQAGKLPGVLASAMADLHALDPRPVRDRLIELGDVPITVRGLLDGLREASARYQRADLADAAGRLIDHPPAPASEVICHGDLHPFNILAGGGQVTVLDWSAALLAPRAYDVAFTAWMLSEPPLLLPGPLRSPVRRTGRLLGSRFIRHYQAHAATAVSKEDLRWHQAVVCLRALVEVAGWVHDGTADDRAGHPWLASGPALAAHLTSVTGVLARPL
jgi:aminoglycoside phosphotransferase (APT) family kinase protein